MPKKSAGLLSLAVCGGLVCTAADDLARAVVQTRVASFLREHPSVHVAAVDGSAFGRGVLLRDVVLPGVTIRELRLPSIRDGSIVAQAMAEPMPALTSAGTIQADDVAITAGDATIRIKRIDLAGTKLTDADLRALLNAKAPDGIEARLRKLTATAIVIPEIAIDDATHGAERHAIVRQVLLAGVVAGKAASFSAAQTSIAVTSGDDAVDGTTGGIEAANADLAQLGRVLAARHGDPAEPVRPLFAKAQVNALKLANVTRGASISAARIDATDVAARPLDQSLAAAAAVAAQAGSSAASNAVLLDGLTQSVSIGTLDVDDAASQGNAAGEDARVAAAHVGIRDLGARGIGAIAMRGFRMEGAYASLAIGTASLGPVPVAAKAVASGSRLPGRPSQVELGQVEVAVQPRDKPATEALRFKVEHAALAQEGGPTAIPAAGSATIDRLTFQAAPGGTTRPLYDMGYRGVDLSASLASSYDADAQEFTIRKLTLAEPSMGSAQVELRLAGVTQDLLSPDAETSQAAAIGIVAKSFDVAIVDAGLADKALALMARRDGTSVDKERAYYVDLFSDKLPTMLGDGPGVKTLGAALAKFVAAPKSLHVSIGSKGGLGIGAIGLLGDPGALLDQLDIKASADE